MAVRASETQAVLRQRLLGTLLLCSSSNGFLINSFNYTAVPQQQNGYKTHTIPGTSYDTYILILRIVAPGDPLGLHAVFLRHNY